MNRVASTILPPPVATLVALLLAIAMAPPGARGLEPAPLPEVDLGAYDPEVRGVLEAARGRVEALRGGGAADSGELAAAYGELGRAALFYLLPDLAGVAFENAASLAPDDFRWHYHLGALHHDGRSLPEARAELERALALRPADGPTLVRLGRVLLLLDEPARAAPFFERARDLEGWTAAALYGLGQCAVRRDDPARAVEHFERALELQPEAAEIRQQLAIAYRDAGRPEAAREQLASGVSGELTFPDPLVEGLAGDFANSAVYRGLAAEGAGRLREAAEEYAKAVESSPDNAAYRQALGGVLMALRDLEGAVRELREAVRLAPDEAMLRVALARALVERDGFTEESTTQFETARRLAPDLKEARVGTAQSMAKLGRLDEAVDELQAAAELDPEDASVRLLLGETLLLLGRSGEALEHLEVAFQGLPDRPQARLSYGRALLRQGDAEEGRTILEQLIDGDADGRQKSLAHLELAESLDRLGEVARALEHYRRAADLLPEYKPPQLGLARSLARAGRHAEAADVFSLVLLIDPQDLEARRGRARALAGAGRVDEAIAELETAREAMAQATDRFALDLLLAAVLQGAGRVEEAIERLEGLVAETPESPEAHFNLALALGSSGRSQEAIEHLQQVVTLAPEDVEAQLLLAQLWSRAERFTEAHAVLETARRRLPTNPAIARALAYLLVGSPDPSVRDPAAALPLALELHEERPTADHAALVAAALAGAGRLVEAVDWQTRALAAAEEAELPPSKLDLLRRDLARYRQGT